MHSQVTGQQLNHPSKSAKTPARQTHVLRHLTFHHFEHRPLLQTLDGLELGKVVQHISVQLQRETGAVAGVLTVHQHLMDFLHHFLRGDLMFRRK